MINRKHTARNPWLEVALGDYEGHMALPQVAQSQLLADVLSRLLDRSSPSSVAVVGCAGGNGFDRMNPAAVERVVGIDINRTFLDTVDARYGGRFRSMTLVCADIERDPVEIEPVSLVYAALLLEYTEPATAFGRLRGLARPGGSIAVVSQLPSDLIPEITPSPFASLSALGSAFRFVDPAALTRTAVASGCQELESRLLRSAAGKEFRLQVFRA